MEGIPRCRLEEDRIDERCFREERDNRGNNLNKGEKKRHRIGGNARRVNEECVDDGENRGSGSKEMEGRWKW